jgi:hypothetical protein
MKLTALLSSLMLALASTACIAADAPPPAGSTPVVVRVA